jgi:hypothetical protein
VKDEVLYKGRYCGDAVIMIGIGLIANLGLCEGVKWYLRGPGLATQCRVSFILSSLSPKVSMHFLDQ